jgi:hypothetical protein
MQCYYLGGMEDGVTSARDCAEELSSYASVCTFNHIGYTTHLTQTISRYKPIAMAQLAFFCVTHPQFKQTSAFCLSLTLIWSLSLLVSIDILYREVSISYQHVVKGLIEN